MKNLAPIVLFVYNRPQQALNTLEALAKNDLAKDSSLFIYADGPKAVEDKMKIEETRKILRLKQWCKEVHIIESEENKGLATSIVEGVTKIINLYGKAIVLEDDIVTSPFFLQYMNESLTLYEKEDKVMHISGYVPLTTGAQKLPDTYFLRFMSCWGWATWKRAWDTLITDIPYLYKIIPQQKDFDDYSLNNTTDIISQLERNYNGTLNTWAVKWYSTIFLYNGLCLYPKYSLVQNIGFDGSGENTYCSDGSFQVNLASEVKVYPIKIEECKYAKEYLMRFYIYGKDSSWKRRLKKYIKSTNLHKLYVKIRY